ncbi:hypothetical protein PIROE2DRAFT_5641 [Piromyces sp. E2]|nr:hypothetical protein PIROE2DRAFT_5641 [Piromyces sp. E2]|eukprot:OUM67031.1 hypothetical protein PIROE2DRAFT_5641 [Piromyces sp. E2]
MEFHRGNFKVSSKFAQELYYKGIERNNWKNKCLSTSLIYLNYLAIDDIDDMSLILNIMKLLDQLGDKPETVNYTIQLLFYALIADVKFRLHVDILNNIFHYGGEQSKICINILNSMIDILENHFQTYLLSVPFLALCYGLKYLIIGKIVDALKSWKKGIISNGMDRNLTGMPYLNGLIYSKLVQYSSNSADIQKYKNLFEQLKLNHSLSIEDPVPLKPEEIKKPVIFNNNNNSNNDNLITKFMKFRAIINNMENPSDSSTTPNASLDTRGSATYQVEDVIHHGLPTSSKGMLSSTIENSVNKGMTNKPAQISTNPPTQISIAQQKNNI